jgi:hypothetical protein
MRARAHAMPLRSRNVERVRRMLLDVTWRQAAVVAADRVTCDPRGGRACGSVGHRLGDAGWHALCALLGGRPPACSATDPHVPLTSCCSCWLLVARRSIMLCSCWCPPRGGRLRAARPTMPWTGSSAPVSATPVCGTRRASRTAWRPSIVSSKAVRDAYKCAVGSGRATSRRTRSG